MSGKLFLKRKSYLQRDNSVQFSRSVASELWPHGLQHARLLYHQHLELAQTHVHWVRNASNHLVLCHSLLLLLSVFPSIRVFSSKSVLHIRWPKYRSFSFSISPSNEYSGLFPLGWIGWISLQSKGLSIVFSNTTVKASVLRHSAFLWSTSHIHIWQTWIKVGYTGSLDPKQKRTW